MINIGGFQKSSLIDYPEKISAIIFTLGCNFRCPYCHNPELIFSKDKKNIREPNAILNFLNKRKGKLDGVVITGGEPTLYADLPEFIKQIKDLEFDVKLDSNGTNPDMLSDLIAQKLINYVAMDIKAPLDRYEEIICNNVDLKKIQKSINILMKSGIDYEFRTTVVKSQLTINDFRKIGELISGANKYYLQRFLPTKTLNESFMTETTYSDEEFEKIMQELRRKIKIVELR